MEQGLQLSCDRKVGRTPWGAPSGPADAPVGLRSVLISDADFIGGERVQGDPRGPGGSPHHIQRRRRGQRGLTLVELIVAFTIMLILTTMAVPLARSKVRAEREGDLRACLREMRDAIDKYHDLNMAGYFGPMKEGADGYPETLEMLVEGVKVNNAQGTKMRFLRRIPRDPFTGKNEWGLRSDQDETTAQSWGGQNVFDVYSKTSEKGSDGTPYSEW